VSTRLILFLHRCHDWLGIAFLITFSAVLAAAAFSPWPSTAVLYVTMLVLLIGPVAVSVLVIALGIVIPIYRRPRSRWGTQLAEAQSRVAFLVEEEPAPQCPPVGPRQRPSGLAERAALPDPIPLGH
jgi:hypothetical protein